MLHQCWAGDFGRRLSAGCWSKGAEGGEQQTALRGPWVLHPLGGTAIRGLQHWDMGGRDVSVWPCAAYIAQQAR